MLRLCLLLLSIVPLLLSFATNAQSVISVASATQSDSSLASPSEFLGYPLGQWHLRHDQINYYLKQLAQNSPRVSLESTGQSHETRQQLTAVITSAANQARLAEIVQGRQQVKAGKAPESPLIIWLAYSIHGDEASGAHAALEVSYRLSQNQEPWVQELLDKAVVLITPSQNPDGLDRFSTWTNNYTGKVKVSDENHNEHRQNWPAGRRNHYFADLNRDWLFLRHPESQGRIALFHKWQPHYLGDFHEMGHNQTFFFQPGVPTRTHPLTPKENQVITSKLASFHAKALDESKQRYFTKQMFDDFYYGKGSTYPDINGAVGILFEQASVRGQQQDSENGLLRFSQAINNQIATSFSSLKGALALADELKQYQSRFYQRKDKHPPSGREAGFLLGAPGDPGRRDDLAQLLSRHGIAFFYLKDKMQQGRHQYSQDDSLFVPINQPQKTLLLAMFDLRTEFEDATFYDVSSWNLAFSYNLQMARNVNLNVDDLLTEPHARVPDTLSSNNVAVLIDWRQQNAAPMLQTLLSEGVRVKFAAKPFSLKVDGQSLNMEAGTLQIPVAQAAMTPRELIDRLTSLAEQYRVQLQGVDSGLASSGIDLGSPDFHDIAPIKALVVTGYGTSSAEVGELWYFMDNLIGAPLTQVDISRLPSIELAAYTHLFLMDGSYANLDEKYARKLGQFAIEGGVIVAQKGALQWLSKGNLLKSDIREKRYFSQLFATDGLSFGDKAKLDARQAIGGAVLALDLDTSHPITFGLGTNRLPVLKNKVFGLSKSQAPFITAASYADEPLLDGFLAEEYQRSLSQTPAIVVERHGKGALVALADNLLFRNIWLGSQKVYANSLYFIPALH
ncbi:M14 family zinc carboxypeptidase [Shewanella loihica]|uniref:Peptidase M14, carboxypeptidase A n=1 Tax=Shewanella loihica (strain ATCC BAA-1088 / PV-4) TaxID=323850 RepID=A3Q929_SHELP|nr:M14 family zinc carboxypeptidase [Shewanella loihica]ABO21977.1 peptidase M14, carboxypeptidase A [Shewanella loihica PV-4]